MHPRTHKILAFSVALFAMSIYSSKAQYEYLSTLNYQTLAVNRIANIPGVTWVTGNSTYDENHQRFFFQGNATGAIPFRIYSIDAPSGAVLFNPVCPSGVAGQIAGPEYDNATDTLYTIYFDGAATPYFSWIEPTTGVVHPLKMIPSFAGFQESAFDTKDHWYLCNTGLGLLVIDASSGNVINNPAFAFGTHASNIVFDNTTGKLFGIYTSLASPNPQLVSLTLATAAAQVIGNLPALSLPDIGTYTIDEGAGKYIFVGTDPPGSACINNYLYVIDINTGAVLSKTLYPDAQDASQITAENVIDFSFDNQRNVLYALNWHPPPGNPYINIMASANPICPGDAVTFKATPAASVVNPAYQWLINGVNTGTNSPSYANSSLQNNDTVYCLLTNNDPCAINRTDTSNRIIILYNPPVTASVSIATSATTICIGDTVKYTATPVNGGASPAYQWQVNGGNAGTDTDIFVDHSLQNGDGVNCILTSSSNCALNKTAVSNNLVMQVNSVNTTVSIIASATTICSGDTVIFTATPVNGGNSPAYQWQIDGSRVGKNEARFSTDALNDGDQVTCILTGSITCSLPVNSDKTITMTVNPTPTLLMGQDTVIRRGEYIRLAPVIRGNITSYQWTPVAGLDDPSIPAPVATPVITTTYRLEVETDKGCKASGERTIIIYTPLQMPNAFTPNGDGKNDFFRVPAGGSQKIIRFAVYNRWGELLFISSDSSTGWDGTFSGQPQPAGTYVWKIEFVDLLTGKAARTGGTVELIR